MKVDEPAELESSHVDLAGEPTAMIPTRSTIQPCLKIRQPPKKMLGAPGAILG